MNKGTHEGDKDEKQFVVKFNSNKDGFYNYLTRFGNIETLWMVRVSTKQISSLCGKAVYTRADCYLVNIDQDISRLLEINDRYLSEDILVKNDIKHSKILYSGISIKMASSKNYQILKLVPNSFEKLFGDYELGAGDSLFCDCEDELYKNLQLVDGWNSSMKVIAKYFEEFTGGEEGFYLNKDTCKQIKKSSCSQIKKRIDVDENLQKKIFNGVGLYNEPYTAHFFYHGKEIRELTMIPFTVTTGSGRSKGRYTIVLKP